ncbi:MAG: 3-coathanger stack domain-containing protein [Flavobacterium sp.]
MDRAVSYLAGKVINLNPGFSTINGQTFSSIIQNTCPN